MFFYFWCSCDAQQPFCSHFGCADMLRATPFRGTINIASTAPRGTARPTWQIE
jgi:hypothetical protein